MIPQPVIELRLWCLAAFALLLAASYAADLYARWMAPTPAELRRFPLSGFAGVLTALIMLSSSVGWMAGVIPWWAAGLLAFVLPLALAYFAEVLFQRRMSSK